MRWRGLDSGSLVPLLFAGDFRAVSLLFLTVGFATFSFFLFFFLVWI